MRPQLPRVPDEVGLPLVLVVGAGRVEERVQRDLGVDDHPPPADQVDDEVGSLDPVVGAGVGLLGEVAAVHQTGQLDRPLEVHLAPAPAHLRLAQRRGQGLGLAAQGVGGHPHVQHLLAQLALPAGPLVVEVAHLVAEPVETLDQLGPVDAGVHRRADVRRPRPHPEHAQRRAGHAAETEPHQQHEHRHHHAEQSGADHRQCADPVKDARFSYRQTIGSDRSSMEGDEMGTLTVRALRVVLAAMLAGSLFVQVVMVPLFWQDLDDASAGVRVPVVAIVVLGIVCVQVVALCVWRLLTMVRRDTVFSPGAFRFVDVIAGAVTVASLLTFALGVVLAPGEDVAPGLVLLIGGLGVCVAGVALVVMVLRALLSQAMHLRTELDAVI